MLNQQFQEPFLAVVIDPTRTVSAGKVEIGAFRTYPEGYKLADEPISEYQTIPLNKIEDFGVHSEKLQQAENQLGHSHFAPLIAPSQKKKEEESQLAEITRDSAKITVEQVHGLMSQVIKAILFNSVHQLNRPHTELSGPKPMVES
ncbi:hypothetical protein ACSBR2_021721 [Camellia fascicularis]